MDYFDLDQNLTQEDKLMKRVTHEFARDLVRPISRQLDEMTPQQVIADDSPFGSSCEKPMN